MMFVIFQLARGGQVARAVKKQLEVIEASEANRKEDDDSSLVETLEVQRVENLLQHP